MRDYRLMHAVPQATTTNPCLQLVDRYHDHIAIVPTGRHETGIEWQDEESVVAEESSGHLSQASGGRAWRGSTRARTAHQRAQEGMACCRL